MELMGEEIRSEVLAAGSQILWRGAPRPVTVKNSMRYPLTDVCCCLHHSNHTAPTALSQDWAMRAWPGNDGWTPSPAQ